MRPTLLLSVLLAASPAAAQHWEAGAAAAVGFSSGRTAAGAAGQADAGFARGLGASAYFGQNLYRYFSGEFRYTFQRSDLRLTSGGAEVRFRGLSHAVHYDWLVHSRPAGARVRPFAVAGAGVKQYRGTSRESAWQPLSQFALLTKTREWKSLLTAGAGVKFAASPRVTFRVELRSYVTSFPDKVIAPAPGAKIGGWLHTWAPLAGVSATF